MQKFSIIDILLNIIFSEDYVFVYFNVLLVTIRVSESGWCTACKNVQTIARINNPWKLKVRVYVLILSFLSSCMCPKITFMSCVQPRSHWGAIMCLKMNILHVIHCIMSFRVAIVSPSDTIYMAAKKMRELRVNSAIVSTNNKPQGILTLVCFFSKSQVPLYFSWIVLKQNV